MRLPLGTAVRLLKRLLWWPVDAARWLWEAFWEGLHSWLLVVALVICVVVALGWPCPVERLVQLIGMILLLLGLVTIVLRLWAARRQFPEQWWRRWLQRRPRLRARHIVISATGAALGISSGRARARVTLGPQATLDQRVAMLEGSYTKLFDEVGSLGNELNRRSDELTGKLHAEAAAREGRTKRLRSN
jgi:hypothetical protein